MGWMGDLEQKVWHMTPNHVQSPPLVLAAETATPALEFERVGEAQHWHLTEPLRDKGNDKMRFCTYTPGWRRNDTMRFQEEAQESHQSLIGDGIQDSST
jgi:hypothetical protein